jgi:hypothetical protein
MLGGASFDIFLHNNLEIYRKYLKICTFGNSSSATYPMKGAINLHKILFLEMFMHIKEKV